MIKDAKQILADEANLMLDKIRTDTMIYFDTALDAMEAYAAQWREENPVKPPLPEAQPLEGVKTETQIIEQIIPNRPWQIGGNTDAKIIEIAEAYHAQFATDAGAGKRNDNDLNEEADLYLDSLYGSNINESPLVHKSYIDGYRTCELNMQSSSTHSSSEMVEVDKVCSILWKEMKYNPSLYIAIADKIRSCVK